MKRFAYGTSITDMLMQFGNYAKCAESLSTIWDTTNDDPEEAAKLKAIMAFAKTCREMLDDLEVTAKSELPYYEEAEEVPE